MKKPVYADEGHQRYQRIGAETPGPRLDPWSVVAFGAPSVADERMMWAQSGMNRMFLGLDDLMRAIGVRGWAAVSRAKKSFRALVRPQVS